MSDADWWARKLGQPAAPPTGYQQTTPPALPPQPSPPVSPYWGARPVAPQPSPAFDPRLTTQQPHENQEFWTYNAAGQRVPDDGHVARLDEAARATGGSKAMLAANGVCPECGSGNYFARNLTEQGMAMRIPRAPQCFDCGFPIIQAGSPSGMATAAKSRGGPPPQPTRQLAAGHDVTVVVEGGTMTFPGKH